MQNWENDTNLDVLCCVNMPTNHANLVRIFNTGIDEERKTFGIIGNCQFHELHFWRAAYYPDITLDKVVSSYAFVLKLIDKWNVNSYVGGKPHIFEIPDSWEPLEMRDT